MTSMSVVPAFQLHPADQVEPGIYKTRLAGLYYLDNQPHPDDRGFYSELVRLPELEKLLGQPFRIQQINHAHSLPKVMRGFHAESWNKLVTITRGLSFCVLADVRPGSPTFGQTESFLLGQTATDTSLSTPALSGCLFVSKGIANSVCVLEGPIDYLYFVDLLYSQRNPAEDVAISLFDPDLAVQWPFPPTEMTISQRDRQAVSLRQRFPQAFTT